jgi:Helix-turn-helix domain of resolvase
VLQQAIHQNISDRQLFSGHQQPPGAPTVVQLPAKAYGRGRPTKFTPERMQQIINLVERGKSRDEIAEIIGVTLNTLQVTCSKLGISLRRPRYDMGTGLLQPRGSHSDKPSHQPSSQPKGMMPETSNGYHAVSGAKPMEVAELATPDREALQERSNGRESPAFAICMAYKGEERSTGIPLDQEMIRVLAIEAEFRSMRIGELAAALILEITRKDLFQLVLANAPDEQSRRTHCPETIDVTKK